MPVLPGQSDRHARESHHHLQPLALSCVRGNVDAGEPTGVFDRCVLDVLAKVARHGPLIPQRMSRFTGEEHEPVVANVSDLVIFDDPLSRFAPAGSAFKRRLVDN
jgi:hypothetical protein